MDDKICPMLLAAQHPNGYCMGGRCGWCFTYWDYAQNKENQRCALNVLAGGVFDVVNNGLPE